MVGYPNVGRAIKAVRDGEVAEAKINEVLTALSPEQEANEELVRTLEYARGTLREFKDIITDIEL